MIRENSISLLANDSSKLIWNSNNTLHGSAALRTVITATTAFCISLPVNYPFDLNYESYSSDYSMITTLNSKVDVNELAGAKVPCFDLLKISNLNKINKMAGFEENWNGNGAKVFSPEAIALFEEIIMNLDQQPEIAPTGRNSLYLQYDANDGSLLAFEVFEKKIEKVFVPRGDMNKAETECVSTNLIRYIEENVNRFYGFV